MSWNSFVFHCLKNFLYFCKFPSIKCTSVSPTHSLKLILVKDRITDSGNNRFNSQIIYTIEKHFYACAVKKSSEFSMVHILSYNLICLPIWTFIFSNIIEFWVQWSSVKECCRLWNYLHVTYWFSVCVSIETNFDFIKWWSVSHFATLNFFYFVVSVLLKYIELLIFFFDEKAE